MVLGDLNPFSLLRDVAQKELLDHLDKYSGSKILVWDESLMAPTNLIASYQILKERQLSKMFTLKMKKLSFIDADNVVFITRPLLSLMDDIAVHIKGDKERRETVGKESPLEYHILFVPSMTRLCENRLKEKSVLEMITFLDELSISWFPLETDVISLEDSSYLYDFVIHEDPTTLYSISKALMSLMALTGPFTKIYGKGPSVKYILDYMKGLQKELPFKEIPSSRSLIDKLVILDRQIDMITPLLTQLTYEGLIDEVYSIQCCSAKFPSAKFNDDKKDSEFKIFTLNSNDELFHELRDKNFNAVGPIISRKTKAISSQFGENHGSMSVPEFKSFVNRLPQMQAMKTMLINHTNIAELIKKWTEESRFLEILENEQQLVNYQNTDKNIDFLEESSVLEYDMIRILRLMCLQSLVNSGLKPSVLERYRKSILHSYGFQTLLTLLNLEKMSLLTSSSQNTGHRTNYAILRKRLHLTVDSVNEQTPNDVAYVYSGYAPITIRLIERLTDWASLSDVLSLLPGLTLEETQNKTLCLDQKNNKLSSTFDNENKLDNNNDFRERILVLFVGGVTYAEISALRYLSQKEDSNVEYLIATTSIINGNNFIKSFSS